MPSQKYCLVDPQGGPLKVTLSVNNGIKSGALFVLWEKPAANWIKKETFKLITGDDGTDDHLLLEKPEEIENDALSWNIQACAQIDGANRGEFILSIFQQEQKLWSKTSNRTVPYCKDGEHQLFGNDVIFKHKVLTDSKHEKLWNQIEHE